MRPLQRADPERVGPYRLLGRLGAGGMGVVYLGRSPSGRPVAVKVIQRRFAGQPRFAARFRREVTAARRVTGVFTAPVLDADPDAPTPWLVTAYLPGLSLREAVGRFGPLPPDAVRPLAAGLAEALADIHRAGVVHRDLKPGNVMLTAGGPRVIDFGIARPEDAVTITRAGAPLGTPGFMAPEQIRGERAGPAADVFALAATLAYAATGKEPFGDGTLESRDLRVLRGQADLAALTEPWLLDLLGACLALDPERRPSATNVLERLGPPDDEAASLLGTRWLPAPVAEEIDLRTAEAAPLREAPPPDDPGQAVNAASTSETDDGVPNTAPSAVNTSPSGLVRPGVTHPDGASPGVAPPQPRVGRRALVVAGAGLLTIGGLGALAWRLTGDDGRGPSGGAKSGPRGSGTSPTPQGPPPTGTSGWARRVSKPKRYLSIVAADDGLVLANGDDGNEILRVLRASTGKVVWTRDGGSNAVSHRGVTYLSLDEAQRVSAVRTATGKTLWTYDPSNYPRDRTPSTNIAVVDAAVVFGSSAIMALNPATGRPRWESNLSGNQGIAAVGDLVVVPASTALMGLDATTGKTRWKYPMDYPAYQLIADGMAYATDRFGTQHAVRADTGAPAWQRRGVGGWSSDAGGGRLYVEARDGEVLALDAATGRQLWSRALLAQLRDDPRGQATALRLAGPTLYVACTDGVLYALNTADGRIQWTYGADESNRTPPATVGGLVFIATPDGRVRAITPPSARPSSGPPPNGGPRATP
ncbi:hypothetical protein GCM10022254_07230 [Actinomadura meridiana]|uniref:Protein kinase domain-containing protein n=2 Tax=Actinomadura meridiana TaxID=559626 RepID=A0ABP8BTB2_9ACTN